MTQRDLLVPVVPAARLNPAYSALVSEVRHAPAREVLRDLFATFPNPDGNFVEDFQTTGFDARIWELYLYAFGKHSPFTVTRPFDRPDFLFSKDGIDVWIEAVTANPTQGPSAQNAVGATAAESGGPGRSDERIRQRQDHEVPIKLGSALYSKLQKEYWTLAHVAGKALVFAIEDFHDPNPFRDTDHALMLYLYGLTAHVTSAPGEAVTYELSEVKEHRRGSKTVPSGFFSLPDAENVSAILFSNSGTLPKFNRMGFSFERHPFVRMVRWGICLDHDATQVLPDTFGYLVGDAPEEWGHGLYAYHNPNAKHPIPVGFLEGVGGEVWVEGGRFRNRFREFSPLSSVTAMYQTKSGADISQMDEELRALAKQKAKELSETLEQGKDQVWRLIR